MDQTFQYHWVSRRWTACLQRQTVLAPLSRRRCVRRYQAAGLTRRLVHLWRRQLHALVENGWVTATGRHMAYMRNCQPAFVHVTPATRLCTVQHLCPFCYARWAGETWQQLTARLAQLGQPYQLTTRLIVRKIPLVPEDARQLRYPTPEDWARYLMESAVTLRGQAMRPMLATGQILGAFHHTTIAPGPQCWLLRHRQLFVAPAGPPLLLPSGQITVYAKPTARDRYLAGCQTLRYPAELLHGDPALTAILLRARVGGLRGAAQPRVRLSATYGCLRG